MNIWIIDEVEVTHDGLMIWLSWIHANSLLGKKMLILNGRKTQKIDCMEEDP